MDPMVTDDGPPNGTPSLELSDPPAPEMVVNFTLTDILQEFSKIEPFDEKTCSWPDYAECLQEQFDLYNVPNDKRVKIFIDRISNATYEKLRGICKPVAPLDKPLDELWKIMDRYFNRYWNILRERVKFIRRNQRPHESVLKYATELKRWAKNCRYPEFWQQEALITQFMNGVRSDVIQKKLFDLKEDDFDQIVEFACNVEEMQATLNAAVDKAAALNAIKSARLTNAAKGSNEAQTSNAMEVDKSSDAIVCYHCFEPGHKSPACELKKQNPPAAKKAKANKNQTESSNQETNGSKNQPTNPTKNKPTNQKKIQAKNQNKNQWTNKSKPQVKKQNANQFKFQNKNQFKNQYKPQFTKPFFNYSNEPGGHFGDDFKNLLRNQYKDLHKKEYSNQYYSNDYSNRSLSTTYQPNNSLFYR